MGALSPMHLILILGIALLILGPKRLPESGEALGRALREFRDAMNGIEPPAAPDPRPTPEIASAQPAPEPPPAPPVGGEGGGSGPIASA